jgi:hypothetical protein
MKVAIVFIASALGGALIATVGYFLQAWYSRG